MIFFYFAISLFIYAYVNGSLDYVGHHLDYLDLWHGIKYLDRITMCAVGYFGGVLVHDVLAWHWVSALCVTVFMGVMVIFAKILVWEYAYRSEANRARLDRWDDKFVVNLKWKWLEKQLGFHR